MAPPAPAASTVTPRASKNRTGVEVARRIALDLRLTTRTMTAGSNIYGSQPGPLVHQPRASDFARPLAFSNTGFCIVRPQRQRVSIARLRPALAGS